MEECITYEAFVDGAAYADRAYVENPAAFGATPQAVEYIKRTRNLVEDIRAFILAHRKDIICRCFAFGGSIFHGYAAACKEQHVHIIVSIPKCGFILIS